MAFVRKNASTIAAQIASEHPVFDAEAQKVATAVRAEAAKHNRTGRFLGSIKVETVKGPSGVTDRLVYSDDPNALSIEYGHFTAGDSPKWVPGIFAFTKAHRG